MGMKRRYGRGRRTPDAAAEAARAAASVRTLAVLLHAGATPLTAWQHLAESGDEDAAAIVERCENGTTLVSAIDAAGGVWSDVAAAWEVATTVGAPLAEILRALAESLQDSAVAADDVRVALAEPAGTARLLLWMPVAGLLLGFALGFDTLGAIATPGGGVCVAAGLLLVVLARAWTGRLLRRAAAGEGTPGMRAELVAVGLAGGASIERSLRLVAQSTARRFDDEDDTRRVLDLSRSAGVPAGELLRASAARQRHEARMAGRLRAAKLSAQLLIPLGVCTLPAFLLLGVAPLVLSVLRATPIPL